MLYKRKLIKVKSNLLIILFYHYSVLSYFIIGKMMRKKEGWNKIYHLTSYPTGLSTIYIVWLLVLTIITSS